VAIFGAGPAGLMAAHSAALRGAAQVFVVDKAAGRLALAERYGATAVNFADAEVIIDATDGAGVDCGVEAVDYQAHDQSGQEHPEMVLDKLAEVVQATGRIGVVGVYNPENPGAATEDARQGRYGFNYGLVFDKAISMGHGQCPVTRCNHQLRDLIIRGKAQPSLIVSHELPPDQAPRRLRPVRQARGRLDQGPAQARLPGSMTARGGAKARESPGR
jgi:glutathione-independent formaldehyde dehydrogenase